MNSCEHNQILISAAIDDELSFDERLQLEAHLVECEACRRVEAAFQQVDQRVRDGSQAFASLPLEPAAEAGRFRFDKRGVSLAVAASILLVTVTAVLFRSPRANADQLMIPLTEMQLINEHQRATQETVLQTFEWELRALRLQLGQVENRETKRDELIDRLEGLLQRVDEVKRVRGESG